MFYFTTIKEYFEKFAGYTEWVLGMERLYLNAVISDLHYLVTKL